MLIAFISPAAFPAALTLPILPATVFMSVKLSLTVLKPLVSKTALISALLKAAAFAETAAAFFEFRAELALEAAALAELAALFFEFEAELALEAAAFAELAASVTYLLRFV